MSMKEKEIQFFGDRSDLISNVTNYIRLCQEVGRDVAEELDEVLFEATKECHIKLDIFIENEK